MTTVAVAAVDKPFRVLFSGNIDKTCEDLILLARKRGQEIELWDARRDGTGGKVILTVSKHEDVSEVPAPPLRVPMMDLIADSALHKGERALAVALRFARAYDYQDRRDARG